MGGRVEREGAHAREPLGIRGRGVAGGRVALQLDGVGPRAGGELDEAQRRFDVALVVDADLGDDGDVVLEVLSEQPHGGSARGRRSGRGRSDPGSDGRADVVKEP